MTNALPAKPALLLFIHGLWSSSKTAWGRFPQLLREDARLSQKYHIDVFDYPTGLTGDGYSVTEIALFLRTKMETDWRDYPEVAIMAHSQGGLVTRRYIADCFNHESCCRITRVLFFATPHSGALLAKLGSEMPFAGSFLSPQTLGLAYNSAELRALYLAEAACDAHLRVRTKFVVAAEDSFVTSMSAWGSHGPGDYLVLPCESHDTLIKPQNKDHPSFRIAREFLLEENIGGMVEADYTQPLLKQKWNADQTDEEAERDRFVYTARSIPLVGREREMEQIEGFLGDPRRRFAWMILHGPGGIGKSRLALEAILRRRGGWWNAGFLDERHLGPDWTVWQPRLPTFLVIDYAASAEDRVAALIASLSEREGAHQLKQPVRLILIERQTTGRWLDGILAASRKGRSHRAPDLGLGPLASVWPVFEHVWAWRKPERHLPDEQEVLACFAELDPLQRPLFAMLMADAIARHGVDRQWSREALLEDVLARERERFWQPAARKCGFDPQQIGKEERALVLATMMGGLRIKLMDRDHAGLLPRWDRDRHRELFKAISEVVDEVILPLTPDLIGEFFALNLLQKEESDARALVELAWHLSPGDMAQFVGRCWEDFPEHPALARTYFTEIQDDYSRFGGLCSPTI